MSALSRFRRPAPALPVWALLIYVALLLVRAPWHAVDYVFAVVFHFYILLFPGFFCLFSIFLVFAAIEVFTGVLAQGNSTPLRRVHNRFVGIKSTLAKLLKAILVLYCFSLLVAAVSENAAFGLCVVFFLALADLLSRKPAGAKTVARLASALMAAVACSAGLAVCVWILTRIPVSPPLLAIFAAFILVVRFRPGLFPSISPGTLWDNLSRNRISFVASALLIFSMYYLWIPNINRGNRVPSIGKTETIGSGAGIEFSSDGKHLFYLNKGKKSVDLIDKKTLRTESFVRVWEYPRQMAYDRERELLYVVDHGAPAKQLKVISTSPFRLSAAVTIPHDKCVQVNAVAVDYRRNRIMVGCDDSGRIFYVDRDSREVSEAGGGRRPAGVGIVRIVIQENRGRALTFGCLFGPFIYEYDLAANKVRRVKYTGYLVWETVRDSAGGRIFLSVPFRSIVAVLDEKSLRITRVIRSGFGARALAIDKKYNRLFIGSQISGLVEVYDLSSLKCLKRFYLPFPRYFLYDDKEGILYVAGSFGLTKVRI
jgi:DNA-binding beta-propeller fold protein YncE